MSCVVLSYVSCMADNIFRTTIRLSVSASMNWVKQDFLNDERAVDQLLRWLLDKRLLADMRGAGEPVFGVDCPPGSDVMGEIMGGPMAAEFELAKPDELRNVLFSIASIEYRAMVCCAQKEQRAVAYATPTGKATQFLFCRVTRLHSLAGNPSKPPGMSLPVCNW